MNEYSAASPSMNDQWLGKTLFSCVRSGRAAWYRRSAPSSVFCSIDGPADAFVGVVRRLIRHPGHRRSRRRDSLAEAHSSVASFGSEYHAGNLPFSQNPGPTASMKSLLATK